MQAQGCTQLQRRPGSIGSHRSPRARLKDGDAISKGMLGMENDRLGLTRLSLHLRQSRDETVTSFNTHLPLGANSLAHPETIFQEKEPR